MAMDMDTYAAVIAKTSDRLTWVNSTRHTVNTILNAANVHNLVDSEFRLDKTMIDATGSREANIEVIKPVQIITVEVYKEYPGGKSRLNMR
jgi:hypothetical protein